MAWRGRAEYEERETRADAVAWQIENVANDNVFIARKL